LGTFAPAHHLGLGPFQGGRAAVKPLNVFPMVIMLIAIILLIYWLRPH
jgi:hypothetical protein